MTKFRVLLGALTTGTLILAFTQSVYAASSENDITGSTSPVDGACVAPLPFFNGEDCSYNESNPTTFGTFWLGPISTAGYYPVGQSPFALGGNTDDTPVIGDGKFPVPLLPGSIITIDDNDTVCDLDDEISGSISLGAATRAFAGGPGTQGEETWGDGDIVFPIPATTVNDAAPNGAGGCDYEIASAGFPPLLQTTNGGTYIFDTDIVENPGAPPEDSWVASSPVGVACVTEGNCGVSVTVSVGGGYSCVENAPGPCEAGPDGGSQFVGTRGVLENFLIAISTDGNGDITAGTIFANNESKVFNVPPDPFNSWDGPLITFTGSCNNCKLASDDSYSFVEGAGTVTLDIGANDSASLVNPTTITITMPPPVGMVSNVSAPGDIKTMTVDYAPPAGTGTEQFEYSVQDGVNPESFATVTVTIEQNTVPVAGDITRPDLDTEGVDPSTLSDSFNALTEGGNMGGNNGVVTTGAATRGTAATDGTNVTYTPSATFFTGTDSFTYTITDDQSEADTGTVTINIPNVAPTVGDAAAETEQGVAVDVPITFTAGNGSVAQHTLAAVAGSGACTVDLGAGTATYTPDADFSGDDTCTVTLTDGDLESADGVITITVNEDDNLVIKFPGGSALDPWSLALLIGLPLLRRRRSR
ncbi:MAG: cadherin-like domain-containing protein [Gammaproteobacteria bacterium]|nr:cadherin-like domain-containing protein [Gammaproteobacteria bacterium]